MIKENYSIKEWRDKEKYYMDSLSALVIPIQPITSDILELTSKLDALYTEASFDVSFLRRKDSRITMDLKNAEAETFCILKQQQLTAGAKVTEADIKGLVKTYLSTHPLNGYGNQDIYTICKAIMERTVFMEQVCKAISEKKSSLIAAVAMLKLDSSFSSAKDSQNDYAYTR